MISSQQLTIKYALLNAFYTLALAGFGGFGTIYLLKQGVGESVIGVATSTGMVAAIVLQLLVSQQIDSSKSFHLGHFNLMIAIPTVGFMIALLLSNGPLALTVILFTICSTLLSTLIALVNAVATFILNQGYSMNIGLAKSAASLAYALGSYVIGLLIAQFGPASMVVVAILSYLSYILVITRIPFTQIKEQPQNEIKTIEVEQNENLSFFALIRRNGQFRYMLLGVICFMIAHNLINTFMFQILENVGGNVIHMGTALFIASAVELPMVSSYSIYSRRVSNQTLVIIAGIFFTLKALMTLLAQSVAGIYLAQSLQIFTFGIYSVAGMLLVNSLVGPRNASKGQALFGIAGTLGGVIGNSVGGMLIERYSVQAGLVFGVLVSVLGLVFFFRMKAQSQTEHTQMTKQSL